MHPAIGILIRNGKEVYYAYVNGYNQEPVEDTLESLESILAGNGPIVEDRQAAKNDGLTTYTVTLRFEFPAWDEADGLVYRDIVARSRKDANEQVRRMARDDGHIAGGKGRVWLSAEECSDE